MTDQTLAASTPRSLAAYLTAIRGLMEEATIIRRSWLRQVGMLILDARTKPPDLVAPMVLRCGKENRELFVGFRVRLDELKPPTGCDACQAAFAAWLDKQTAACDALVDIGSSGDLAQLRAVQRLLADGRVDTQAFNAEYGSLVVSLKQRIAARKATKGRAWLFGRGRHSA